MKQATVYTIDKADRNVEGLRKVLETHPEIRFVSLTAVDLGGNDTDEKIPASHFVGNIHEYLEGGVQTDGSSVVLPGIATLNDGKVDLVADPEANWIVDYNYEFRDPETDLPTGTLRIPSFLNHRGRFVDSRSVLKNAVESVERRLIRLFEENPAVAGHLGLEGKRVRAIKLFAATELEFWVRTPGVHIETEKLAVSQVLQESYWKRTKGPVRSALENSLLLLEKYGLAPEMGHKEVGGVKATVAGQGRFGDIMEQLEVDWKYAPALRAADNELLARIFIKEVFRQHGLEVTFLAKPIEGIAGSGEHTHVSIMAALEDGSLRNLFAAREPLSDFLSPLGWGALMGLLRNYEAVGPFVTASNDGFNRLKPGFEAPVCIVASIGHDVTQPSRNRTVLFGLVRDQANPMATRFEVRAPNPHTNSFLALSAFYQAMADGMSYAARSGKSAKQLEAEFSKRPGEEHPYLEQERAYHSEEDVFEHFNDEERRRLFGIPPATVWETLENLTRLPEKAAVLACDGVFSPGIIEAYRKACLTRWTMEIYNRIIPLNADFVRSCTQLHEDGNDLDQQRWNQIQRLRTRLFRDESDQKAVFTEIREAIDRKDYETTSRLQLEMGRMMQELRGLYQSYRRNILPTRAPRV
ncbi:MAG: glutamine synthetase [Acidobacteria bacterium]|nr:MAG: glutamine synthetase [Acidobacteriota bacterium]